jgi:predicted DNA-binding ribbon-helix-helix protein
MSDARVVKRSLVVAGHATSVSLEEPFWSALRELAAGEGLSVAALVARVDQQRSGANLSSALRVHVLRALQQRASLSSPGPAGATMAAGPD